jgi:hypothetical protein
MAGTVTLTMLRTVDSKSRERLNEAVASVRNLRRRSSTLRSVMSRAIFEAPMTTPCSFRIGETVIERSSNRPSFARRTVSKCSTRTPRRIREMISFSSSRRSAGIRIEMCFPFTSDSL